MALGLAGAMLVGSMGADADLASANGYKNGSRKILKNLRFQPLLMSV